MRTKSCISEYRRWSWFDQTKFNDDERKAKENQMSHKKVYENFKRLFGNIEPTVFQWFQNGKNSIRLRVAFKEDMIFTYDGPDNWRLESIDRWMRIGG